MLICTLCLCQWTISHKVSQSSTIYLFRNDCFSLWENPNIQTCYSLFQQRKKIRSLWAGIASWKIKNMHWEILIRPLKRWCQSQGRRGVGKVLRSHMSNPNKILPAFPYPHLCMKTVWLVYIGDFQILMSTWTEDLFKMQTLIQQV